MITRNDLNTFWFVIFDDLIRIAEIEMMKVNKHLPKEEPTIAPTQFCNQRETKETILKP